jgi:hypothetical protein
MAPKALLAHAIPLGYNQEVTNAALPQGLSMDAPGKTIGYFTLEKDTIFTDAQESAAAHRSVKVHAGTYPIRTYDSRYGYLGRYAVIEMAGVVIGHGYYSQSMSRTYDDVGKPGESRFSGFYKYELRNAHDSGKLFWDGKVTITDMDGLDACRR